MASSITVSKPVLHTIADADLFLDVESLEHHSAVAAAALEGITLGGNIDPFVGTHIDLGEFLLLFERGLIMLMSISIASVGAQFQQVDSDSTCRTSRKQASVDRSLASKL